MPSVKAESGSETDNNTLLPEMHVDALPRHMRKARATGHVVFSLLESDSEQDNDGSDYKPSSYALRMARTESPHAGVRGRRRKSNLIKKIRALVRIGDRIAPVDAEMSVTSCTILTINGRRPADVLYEYLDPDVCRSEDATRAKLSADQDFELANEIGNSGHCQGCLKPLAVRNLSHWIGHKIKCPRLQEKLQAELKGKKGKGKKKGITETSSARNRTSDVAFHREQRHTIIESGRPASNPADDRTEDHEMVTIRLGNRMEQFKYTIEDGLILFEKRPLSQVFYEVENLEIGDRLWTLFANDPDMRSFSNMDNTCICRGCNETISIKNPVTWLEHRLRCPSLRNSASLPERDRNEEHNVEEVSADLRPELHVLPDALTPGGSSVNRTLKRKGNQFSGLEQGEQYVFGAHPEFQKKKKQAASTSAQG